jgi:hypothetical protein
VTKSISPAPKRRRRLTKAQRKLTKAQQIAHICAEVAAGRSLHSVLTEDEGMPHPTTFWEWHAKDEKLASVFARARENGVEALLEKAIHIAENPILEEELVEEVGPDGVKRRRTVKDAIAHRRLIIDTYLKRAMLIKPRQYGNKEVDVTVSGEIGVRKVDQLDDVARAARIASLLQRLQSRMHQIEQADKSPR